MIIMHLWMTTYWIKGWIYSKCTLSWDMGICLEGGVGVKRIIANFSDIVYSGVKPHGPTFSRAKSIQKLITLRFFT